MWAEATTSAMFVAADMRNFGVGARDFLTTGGSVYIVAVLLVYIVSHASLKAFKKPITEIGLLESKRRASICKLSFLTAIALTVDTMWSHRVERISNQ